MTYVDCMIAAVPTANEQAYLDHAKLAGDVFRKHGALKLVEHWGDDPLSPFSHAQSTATALPDAQIEITDELGHIISDAAAPEIAARVDSFVSALPNLKVE